MTYLDNFGTSLGIYYDENSDYEAMVLTSDQIEDGHVYCLRIYVDFCDFGGL